ncbi:MAG: MFS transporter [Rhodospirillales bacterium]|nr:MAG: MFS transporter [Rhodospirillales bacterium]
MRNPPMGEADIARRGIGHYALAVLILTAAQTFSTVGSNTAPVLAPLAAADIGVRGEDLAYFVSLIYVACMLGAICGGPLAARLGEIRLTQAGLLSCACGAALFATGSLWLLPFAALCIGFGVGPLTVASSMILSRVTPPSLANVTFSIKQSGVPLGYTLGGLALPAIAVGFGWRWAALALSAACVALALAIHPTRARYETPRPGDGARPGAFPRPREILAPLRVAWADPVLRRLYLGSTAFGVMQTSVVGFTTLFGVERLGMDIVAAGALLSVATAAGAIGRVFWGAVADATGRPLAMLCLVGMVMSAGGIAYAGAAPDWPRWALYGVAAVLGATALGWHGVMLAEVARRAPPGRVGEYTGAAVLFMFIGPMLAPLVFRAILYATSSYAAGFSLVAAATAVSALALATMLRSKR